MPDARANMALNLEVRSLKLYTDQALQTLGSPSRRFLVLHVLGSGFSRRGKRTPPKLEDVRD